MFDKNIFKDLESAYARQSEIFYGDTIYLLNFKKIYNEACEKYIFCLSKKFLKHFPKYLIRHSDEYCTFSSNIKILCSRSMSFPSAAFT